MLLLKTNFSYFEILYVYILIYECRINLIIYQKQEKRGNVFEVYLCINISFWSFFIYN